MLENPPPDAKTQVTSVCPVVNAFSHARWLAPRTDGKTGLWSLFVAIRRLGASWFVALSIVAVAPAANGWRRLLGNLIHFRVDIREMTKGPFDHEADTGVLHDGTFNEIEFRRLVGFSSDGESLSVSDIARLIAADDRRQPSRLGCFMSRIEFAVLCRVFGEEPVAVGQPSLRIPIATLEALYREQRWPSGWRPTRRASLIPVLVLMRRLGQTRDHSLGDAGGTAKA